MFAQGLKIDQFDQYFTILESLEYRGFQNDTFCLFGGKFTFEIRTFNQGFLIVGVPYYSLRITRVFQNRYAGGRNFFKKCIRNSAVGLSLIFGICLRWNAIYEVSRNCWVWKRLSIHTQLWRVPYLFGTKPFWFLIALCLVCVPIIFLFFFYFFFSLLFIFLYFWFAICWKRQQDFSLKGLTSKASLRTCAAH